MLFLQPKTNLISNSGDNFNSTPYMDTPLIRFSIALVLQFIYKTLTRPDTYHKQQKNKHNANIG